MKPQKLDAEKYFKMLVFVLLVCLLIGIDFLVPGFYSEIWRLSMSGDIEGTVVYLRSFGVWAMLISFLVDVLINSLGFLPSIFISTANGLLFGVTIGILISWVAESIGVIISFFILRFFLRDAALQVIHKSKRLEDLDNMSGKNGLYFMAIARTLPYFPSGILTAIGAVSKISVRDYVIATFVGKFPSTAIEVIVGHDIVNYEQNMDRLAISVLLITIAYGVIFYYNKRKKTVDKKK